MAKKLDPRRDYLTIELIPEDFPERRRMLALGRLCVVLRQAAFAGFHTLGGGDEPYGPYLLEALLPPHQFSCPGSPEELLAISLALDDLLESRASRWFDPDHRWTKDMVGWLRARYRKRLREARRGSTSPWGLTSNTDRGVRPNERLPVNPERAAELVRSRPEWAELTSALSPAEHAVAEKTLEGYVLGYIWHSRRGRSLSDYLTPAEMRNWRRACRRQPRIREIVTSLFGERKKAWPRLRGLEPMYRQLMKEAPHFSHGLSEMLAFSGSAAGDTKPQQLPLETETARAWTMGQVAGSTEHQFRQRVGRPDTISGREALCLFYLDLLAFTHLFHRLPSLAAYQHAADSARREAPRKAKSSRSRRRA